MGGLLNKVVEWVESIYELALLDDVIGGPGGIANRQAQELSNRTEWLKERAAAFETAGPSVFVGSDYDTESIALQTALGGGAMVIDTESGKNRVRAYAPIIDEYALHGCFQLALPPTPSSSAVEVPAANSVATLVLTGGALSTRYLLVPGYGAPSHANEAWTKLVVNRSTDVIRWSIVGGSPPLDTDRRHELRPGESAYYVRTPGGWYRVGQPAYTETDHVFSASNNITLPASASVFTNVLTSSAFDVHSSEERVIVTATGIVRAPSVGTAKAWHVQVSLLDAGGATLDYRDFWFDSATAATPDGTRSPWATQFAYDGDGDQEGCYVRVRAYSPNGGVGYADQTSVIVRCVRRPL